MKTQSLSLPLPISSNHSPDADWDDRRLLRQARQNRNAFADLYRRHLTRVYRFLLARVGNVEDAQDLTTQTFMAALDGLANYREEGTVASWLLGIARNKSLEHLRRAKPQQPLEMVAAIVDESASPERDAQTTLALEEVSCVLNVIAPDRAEALSLRYFSELSHAEIAEIMGKSEAAIKMLVHRGLRDLRERLANHAEPAGAVQDA